MNQHELLDQYLDDLSRDPNALPLTGLDPTLADMARRVAALHAPSDAPHLAQARVWRRILQSHAHPSTLTEPSSNGAQPAWRNEFMTVYPLEQPHHRHWWQLQSLSLVAALVVILLFAGIIIATQQLGGKSNPPLAGAPALQGSTTPFPSSSPTYDYVAAVNATGTAIVQHYQATLWVQQAQGTLMAPTSTPFTEPTAVPLTPTVGAGFTVPAYQDGPNLVQVGSTHSGELTFQQPRYVYAFDAKAGDLVKVGVEAETMVALQYATLYASNGSIAFWGTNDGSSGGAGGGGSSGGAGGGGTTQSFSTSLVIPVTQDATVYVEVNLSGPTPGSYAMSFEAITVPEIELGHSLDLTWDTALGVQWVDFVGTRGEVVTITVESAADLHLTLRELTSGRIVAEDDDSGRGLNPELYALALPLDGRYRLEIAPFWLGLPNGEPLTVSVVTQPTLSITDGGREVLLTTKTPSLIFTAEVVEGRSYRLVTVTQMMNSNGSVRVVQGGVTLANFSLLPTERPLTETREFIAPTTGTLRLYVHGDMAAAPFSGINPLAQLTVTIEAID